MLFYSNIYMCVCVTSLQRWSLYMMCINTYSPIVSIIYSLRRFREHKTRKWNEGPNGEVKGMETLIAEALVKIKPADLLRWDKQAETARRKRNWSDFSDNSLVRVLVSRWVWKKSKRMKSWYKWTEVFTGTGMNTLGSGRSTYNLV